MIQNGKRRWDVSKALNCRKARRRGQDQLVAFIWVQMEFFLNGRFESLPLSDIVWSTVEGREEWDECGISLPRLWLASVTRSKASSIVRLVFIVDSFVFSRTQLSLCCSLFFLFRIILFPFSFSPFQIGIVLLFVKKYKKNIKKSILFIIPHALFILWFY